MSDRENIQQVARRLRGLRDALDLSTAEVADACGIDEATYVTYEQGNTDIPISFVQTLADQFGVEVPEILFGSSPKMDSYYVTRRGTGSIVERETSGCYESLAEGFTGRVMHPFMVTVTPDDVDAKPFQHDGQEYNYVVEGKLELTVAHKVIVLSEGDSIIFNARLPHSAKALDGRTVRYLAIISQ